MWYRFNEKGTYDFALHTQHGAAHLEVYLDTDLSRPRQQYRKETHPDFGDKFVLTSAPFFVKVQPDARTGELITRFRAHKHLGQGPEDAIQLAYGDVVAEAFPSGGNVLNLDSGATPWRDGDTKWFRLDGPQVDIGRKLQATITIKGDGVKFGVALARESGGNWTLEDRQGPGDTAYTLVTQLALDDRVYVQVTRDDGMTPGDLDVTLLAEVDLSLLLGGVRGEPRIICQTETSGWGADDIELTVNVDGAQLKHIDNDTIGDFDQDDVRDLRQYFPDPIPYTTGSSSSSPSSTTRRRTMSAARRCRRSGICSGLGSSSSSRGSSRAQTGRSEVPSTSPSTTGCMPCSSPSPNGTRRSEPWVPSLACRAWAAGEPYRRGQT